MIRIEPWQIEIWQIEIWQIEIWQIEIRQIEISDWIDAGFWPDWELRRFGGPCLLVAPRPNRHPSRR